MKLLSIAFPNHDTNFSYFDGNEVHYLKLERTHQVKRLYIQPSEWISEVKKIWGIDPSSVDDIIFHFDDYEKHTIPFNVEGLPREDEVVELGYTLKKYLNTSKGWFIPHHFSHSLSTWMLKNDDKANVRIVIDGAGDEGRPWAVFRNDKFVDGGNIKDGSIGWMMRDVGKGFGITAFHHNDIAGKLMALQSYGHINYEFLKTLEQFDHKTIFEIFNSKHWVDFCGDMTLARFSQLDWIRTVHEKIGHVLISLFSQYANKDDVISYSGGVAQNVVWNSMLKDEFPNLIVAPHSSDEGLSLGGLEWLRRKHNLPKFNLNNFPYSQSDEQIEDCLPETIARAAKLLAEGKTVGWMQGNGEVGARALGNRSILFNPSIHNGKHIVNKIKNRENYRPFGASILSEHFHSYFENNYQDDYMLYTSKVKDNSFPAITHVDGTCRIQTVEKTCSSPLRFLLEKFYNITSVPCLLNTSLNVAGRPIAGSQKDALELFNNSNINVLIIGNQIYE